MEVKISFLEFLKTADLRFLQEREVGLDIYFSGLWGLLPAALAVVAATVFLLSIFHLVSLRRQSIPILTVVGLLAFGIGLLGSYLNYRSWPAVGEEKAPRVLTDGVGTAPVTAQQEAVLLSLPLLCAAVVLAECLACSLFLLLFGARERGNRDQRSVKGNAILGAPASRRHSTSRDVD